MTEAVANPGEPESEQHSAKEARRFHATAPMQAAEALRQALAIGEDSYLRIVGYAHSNGRAFFLYGCLDEVFKVCVNITRWAEIMDEPEEKRKEGASGDDRTRHVHRVVREAVIDGQEMWTRKLTEILADLILFESTNEQAYYRVYVACRYLDGYLGLQQDFDEFFACRSGNADSSIKHVVSTIESLQRKIDPAKLWFLRAPIVTTKLPRPGFVFASARQRYMAALEMSDADQRLALGISYEMGHSRPSRSIHPNIGGPRHESEDDRVDRNIGRVGLLAAHVVVAAYRLAGVEPTGIAKQLTEAFQTSDAQAKMEARVQSDYAVGDIVAAYGPDPCLIVDKAKSKYGYSSYKVRFLLSPMLPELPEDWFPADYVRLMMPHRELRDGMVKALETAGASVEDIQTMREIPDADITALLPETFKAMERDGLLTLMFRRGSQKDKSEK